MNRQIGRPRLTAAVGHQLGFARSSYFRAFGPFRLFQKLSGFLFGLSVLFLLRVLIKMCDTYFLALQIELEKC